MRQYAIVFKPRNFDTAKFKYFTVANRCITDLNISFRPINRVLVCLMLNTDAIRTIVPLLKKCIHCMLALRISRPVAQPLLKFTCDF